MYTQTQTTTCQVCGSTATTTLCETDAGAAGADQGLRGELAAARRTIEHLQTALDFSRQIGAAVGILMEREKLTYDAAFGHLVETSQHARRKVRQLAEQLLLTGELPELPEQPAPAKLAGPQSGQLRAEGL